MTAEARLEPARQGWLHSHLLPRVRALLNLVLNLDVLLRTRDPGSWLATWLTYLGIVGGVLTAIITAATRGVIYAANNVLRPHALPIISPALEKMFISWPQLAIGMGFHAHIITTLYMAAPAYTAATLLATLARDETARSLLLPRGPNAKDTLDHILLILAFTTAAAAGPLAASHPTLPAAGWQMLAPHIAAATLWIIYSLATRGLAYRTIGLALTLLYTAIFNSPPREAFKDLHENKWAKPMLESLDTI